MARCGKRASKKKKLALENYAVGFLLHTIVEMVFNGGILIDDDDREEVQEQRCPYTVHSIR